MNGQPPVSLTVRALRAGQRFAAALFVSSIVLHLIGSPVAVNAGLLGVLALIATPALSLIASAYEAWSREPPTAYLALAVLGVLAVATGVALAIAR